MRDTKRTSDVRVLPFVLLGLFFTGLVAAVVYVWLNPPPKRVRVEPVASVEPLKHPAPLRSDYVGSQVCSECHAEIAERYQTHSMAHSLNTVSDAKPVENYEEPNVIEQGAKRFFVERKERQVTHHEQMVDAEGVIYDLAVPVTYALGSGTRGRSYLIQRHESLLQSPLGWYTAGNRWDMSPGYREGGHMRFEREVGDGCLYCHVGRLHEPGDDARQGSDPVFAEMSISCERCHGPGGAHVKAMNASGGNVAGDLHIANLAALAPGPREAICTQCHLLGETVVLRYGRDFFDFRPGNELHDVFVVFTHPQQGGTEKAVSQVEQLHESRCFQASDGKLTCVTCHDPHGSPTADARASFYQERCLTCHAEQGCSVPEPERLKSPAEGSCIHCHMPRAPAHDVPHTSATNHRIPRNPLAEPEAAPSETPVLDPELDPAFAKQVHHWKVFGDAERKLPSREADRARGLAYAGQAEASSSSILALYAEPLLNPLSSQSQGMAAAFEAIGDDVEVLRALGSVYALTNRTEDAVQCWKRVLELSPKEESALYRLAIHYHDANQFVDARGYFEDLLKLRPYLGDLQGRYAHVLSQFEEWPRAIEAAEEGLRLDPSMIKLREWLINVYERTDQKEKAMPHRETLRRLKAVAGEKG